MKQSFAELEAALRGRKRVALTSHVAPDPDGLGSALALKFGLEKIGVHADIVVTGPVARRYAFLDPEKHVRQYPQDVQKDWFAGFDAVVVLDCSGWNRIGAVAEAFPQDVFKICIDHHASTSNFANVTYARVEATATAELIYEFVCEHLELPLDRRMALPIYTALIAETGGFRYSNSTSDAHRLAAICLEHGVEPAVINTHLNESEQLPALKLAARGLANLEVDASGKLAWITLGMDDFAAAGATIDDIAGLVDYPRSIDGVEIAFFAFEDEPKSTKVSFRSKAVADMNVLAARFGGGGHVRAAGALIREDLASAKARLIAEAREVVRTLG